MKRRDFLKGVLGTVAGGLGLGKLALDNPANEDAESPKVIASFKTWEGEYQLLSDGTQLEIPINFVIDNATAEQLSKNESLRKVFHLALKDLEVNS